MVLFNKQCKALSIKSGGAAALQRKKRDGPVKTGCSYGSPFNCTDRVIIRGRSGNEKKKKKKKRRRKKLKRTPKKKKKKRKKKKGSLKKSERQRQPL